MAGNYTAPHKYFFQRFSSHHYLLFNFFIIILVTSTDCTGGRGEGGALRVILRAPVAIPPQLVTLCQKKEKQEVQSWQESLLLMLGVQWHLSTECSSEKVYHALTLPAPSDRTQGRVPHICIYISSSLHMCDIRKPTQSVLTQAMASALERRGKEISLFI